MKRFKFLVLGLLMFVGVGAFGQEVTEPTILDNLAAALSEGNIDSATYNLVINELETGAQTTVDLKDRLADALNKPLNTAADFWSLFSIIVAFLMGSVIIIFTQVLKRTFDFKKWQSITTVVGFGLTVAAGLTIAKGDLNILLFIGQFAVSSGGATFIYGLIKSIFARRNTEVVQS